MLKCRVFMDSMRVSAARGTQARQTGFRFWLPGAGHHKTSAEQRQVLEMNHRRRGAGQPLTLSIQLGPVIRTIEAMAKVSAASGCLSRPRRGGEGERQKQCRGQLHHAEVGNACRLKTAQAQLKDGLVSTSGRTASAS
jgi:hypothetical protein